jgi:hypothetical protein
VAVALEQAGRDVSTLAVRELQLAAARHRPTVRRVLRDIVAVLAIALALLTAFAFLNVAADRALSSVMPDWAAALVLAAAWIALGALLFAVLLRRGERAAGARRWWVALAADPATSVAVCEQARAPLGRLGGAPSS